MKYSELLVKLFIIILFVGFILIIIHLGCGTNEEQVPLDSKTEETHPPFVPYRYKGEDLGDNKPYCGDGICNNGETKYTCNEDCRVEPRKEINRYFENIPIHGGPIIIKPKWR